MIQIIKEQTKTNIKGIPTNRTTMIIISDGTTHYLLGVGGLPLVGDLQSILNARETKLWAVAMDKDNKLTTEQVRTLLYESPIAGGWSNQEFQEAYFEERKGNVAKANALDVQRAAIQTAWPI